MNSTRIEVPLALPSPHFEDERTIATARQVEPIGRAKVTESWRKLRTLLPLVLLAMFCGALGAASVNYYEDRHIVNAVAQPSPSTSTAEPRVEASPVVVAASADPTPNGTEKKPEAISVESKADGAGTVESQTKAVTQNPRDDSSNQPVSSPQKRTTDADATKLTRKRRVNPSDEEPAPANKKGAGRIGDIFSGPNPF